MTTMSPETAKKILEITELTPLKVRAAFRVKVLVGHTDRGGHADITQLLEARNLLLTLPPLSPTCVHLNCTEFPLKGLMTCAFHRFTSG